MRTSARFLGRRCAFLGFLDGQIRVLNAWVARCSDAAPELTTGAKVKSPPQVQQATAVLRVHGDRAYIEKNWEGTVNNPGHAFREWAEENIGRVHDTCGLELVPGPTGRRTCVQGLVRLPASKAAAALSVSGNRTAGQRWFIECCSKQHQIPNVQEMAVDWGLELDGVMPRLRGPCPQTRWGRQPRHRQRYQTAWGSPSGH